MSLRYLNVFFVFLTSEIMIIYELYDGWYIVELYSHSFSVKKVLLLDWRSVPSIKPDAILSLIHYDE